ncbi:MAG: carboxylesterase family protein, partial [Gammaproteobacteria bacterium]|nr:carboxylesterase family protein [Gammaproteobacteria bacterium]
MNGIVSTQQGNLSGIVHEGFLAFRGVPYASPPIGALRFRAPQKPIPW